MLAAVLASGTSAFAQDADASETAASARPTILFNRWQENWSKLADPALRTSPFDNLKYIPLMPSDPQSYMSIGINLRERFESLDAPSFGVAHSQPPQNYVIQRTEVFADIHPNANWQIFVELEDARAFGKTFLTPADEDRVDLEQAFSTYSTQLPGGEFKLRVGRQEMAFDLQRFVSARDGPNVRQAYDAVWADWESGPWRLISFWSHPVQYGAATFDDTSNGHLQYGGVRIERNDIGPGRLSAYFTRFASDDDHYLFASGKERRNILDTHYAGTLAGFDWDLEVMGQGGHVGPKEVRAFAVGTLGGYTFAGLPWTPRLGLQFDIGSGNHNPYGKVLGTFNPLFPNGYYFTLSGYETYTNIIHLKPSVTVHPTPDLKVMAALGLRWRETTADAIYTIPAVPVAGTAGQGHLWTGLYQQLRVDYAFNANLTGAIEAVHYNVGDTIRRAGGHDSDYVGVELKFGW